jgi:hypothetical protein
VKCKDLRDLIASRQIHRGFGNEAIICNNHQSLQQGGRQRQQPRDWQHGFCQQGASGFHVTPDDEDETLMLLIPSKMNMAPIRHGLAYTGSRVSDQFRRCGNSHDPDHVRKHAKPRWMAPAKIDLRNPRQSSSWRTRFAPDPFLPRTDERSH